MTEIAPVRWQPAREQSKPAWPVPRAIEAMWRGACGHCPACGKTNLFRGFLKVTEHCSACSAPLGLARADDAPPYFTILIVGHLIVPAMLLVERAWAPPIWVHTAIWVPMTLALALALLRPIKGATVGVLTACGMLKPDGRE